MIQPPCLSIAIVTWRSDPEQFAEVLASVERAADFLGLLRPMALPVTLHILDNSGQAERWRRLTARRDSGSLQILVEDTGANLGYGSAHNRAIAATTAPFHLILNPDVLLDEEALVQGLACLEQDAGIAALSPDAVDGAGHQLYLCKHYPSLLDLALRGFAPRWLQQRFAARLARYENRVMVESQLSSEVQLISGCFMLCRTVALRAAGGFDERYFLYFEDFALSLALGRQGRLLYAPACRIVHYGGAAGSKGLRHLGYFTASALKFLFRHGWKLR
jgi:GT2 family glycosyltransferase